MLFLGSGKLGEMARAMVNSRTKVVSLDIIGTTLTRKRRMRKNSLVFRQKIKQAEENTKGRALHARVQ